ncbi:membrane protein [Lasius niger]|uniref:Membrane protein n=1 Tax=Lasius niger TaxID=67767 RepID=A0A0J7KU33_LASNI|nr:membrane protein [Lasius niger]
MKWKIPFSNTICGVTETPWYQESHLKAGNNIERKYISALKGEPENPKSLREAPPAVEFFRNKRMSKKASDQAVPNDFHHPYHGHDRNPPSPSRMGRQCCRKNGCQPKNSLWIGQCD